MGHSMQPNPIMAALLLAIGSVAASPARADTPEAAAQEAAPFIPADFAVPTLVEAPGFKLVPLGPALVDIDFAAYMSSIIHLQQTFTRSTGWPRADITAAEAMTDTNLH